MTIYDDFDELASAYLDGETTGDEAARVEADPEIMARVQEFRLLSGAIAEPVNLPDEAARQAAIAAAIGAGAPAQTAPNVKSLSMARAERAQRNSRILSIAAGFAAVVVGGVLVWAIATANRGGDDVATSVTDAASDAVADTAADEAMGDAADADDAMEEEASMEEEAMAEAAMSDDAMEDDAMEDEAAMEDDAMEEAAAVQEEAELEDAATTVRQGDDDTSDAEPATAELDDPASDAANDAGEASSGDGKAARSLPELLSSLTGEPTDGLFVVSLPGRNDYLGAFSSIDELLADPRIVQAASDAGALRTTIEPELAPLEGEECPAIAERLGLAESIALLATAQVLEPVSGANSDLAIVQVTNNGTSSLLGIDLTQCRVLIGEDDLP